MSIARQMRERSRYVMRLDDAGRRRIRVAIGLRSP